MLITIFIVSVIGFGLSVYAYYLEKKIAQDISYKPVCDLSDKVSCSKPILSPYGKLLGISNSLVGMAFYVVIAFLAILDAPKIILILALAAGAVSLYLAWVLYAKIHAACLVCCSIYLVNGMLLVFSLLNR